MILIVTNIAIEAAPKLVNLFPKGAASLVTASDFYKSFKAGILVNDFLSSTIILNGKEITPAGISGVITTIPSFLPVEFYYVKLEDRDYVCAEMNAFFLYFLSELKCNKCNPPDTKMFIGWNAHKLEWAKTAIKLNIPVLPFSIKNGYAKPDDNNPEQKLQKCTIIYDRIMDTKCPVKVQRYTRLLANSFSLPYLDCYYTSSGKKEYALVYINTIPNISTPKNRRAIANYFLKTL